MSLVGYFVCFIVSILIWLFLGWVFSILDHHYEEKKRKEEIENVK